jgi:hypothetical protein
MAKVDLITPLTEVCAPDSEPGSLLTGVVIVSEWVGTDGKLNMTVVTLDPRGGSLAPWRANGMLQFAHDMNGPAR